MVEHRLAKARVASSNLVSRSIPPSGSIRVGYGGLERSEYKKAALPRRGTQVVRERSAKPLCVGSIPTRASNLLNNLGRRILPSSCRLAANKQKTAYTAALCAAGAADNPPLS